ncbi:MAG: class I SAM-dependent methyltransferase [Betaproteobacteria bacterium]|nr:class I SAM-dependent methyltransferase [Betaproteobacteria bacterium]MDH3438029.1 class I SAM-dependent methyltransferase [Betaproteobacteria bacterium]
MARTSGGTVNHYGQRVRAALAVAVCSLVAVTTGTFAAPDPDVPYVPTAPNVVEAMLAIAKVESQDYVVDLGSGDGRIVIAAAKRHGARGFGVDVDEYLVARAREAAERAGVGERVQFFARNLFLTDISRATVLTMYLYPSINLQLRSRLFAELKPGTRVVSHDFGMDLWLPDAQLTVPVPDKPYGAPESKVYLWVIPANAAGTWRWSVGTGEGLVTYEAQLKQRFQMLSGTARAGGAMARLEGGRVRGDALRFSLTTEAGGRGVRYEFQGRVNGDAITGKVKLAGGVELDWRASRIQRAAIDITPAPADWKRSQVFPGDSRR